nr:hypothetical protein [uncultured Sphingomonas sp.]
MTDQSTYDVLLQEICVRLGFCGSVVGGQLLHVDQFIPEHGIVSADQFVDWVLAAEGYAPEQRVTSPHATSLREAFVRHMGAEHARAEQLK